MVHWTISDHATVNADVIFESDFQIENFLLDWGRIAQLGKTSYADKLVRHTFGNLMRRMAPKKYKQVMKLYLLIRKAT